MKNRILIINDNDTLYDILDEISKELNCSISKFLKKDFAKFKLTNNLNYLFLTNIKVPEVRNQILIDKFPVSIFKLMERLNIEFLQLKFNEQSDIKIGNYIFNLNSREMKYENYILKLTEKEISSIIYLSNAKKPVKVNELQSNVWGYHASLETHTVETHIYRLRKKILTKFKDNNFIQSAKDGYQIK